MGFELRREIRAVLPPGGLTPLERHLVLEIADQCGDKTREGFPGAALLALLIDKSERTVEEALKGVGKKWVELRVELGKGADGRPYYSHRSKRTTFRFPKHAELQAAYEKATGIPWASSVSAGLPGATRKKATENPGASDQKPPTFSEEGPEISVESPQESRGPSPQGSTPQNFNTSSLSGHGESVPAPHDLGEEDRERDGSTSFSNPNHTPEQRMVIEAGCPDHLAAEVVDFIEGANPGIRGIGWWKKLLREGDLGDHVQVALASPPQCQRCEGKGEVWSETFGTMVRCDSCPTGPAALDRQPRSSQRPGFTAAAVNVPEGTHTAKMERRREEHRQHSSAAARNWQQEQEIAAEHGHRPALADPWSQP